MCRQSFLHRGMNFVQVFSIKTALHKFVRRVEHCLVRKKPALGIFLAMVGAFDNVIFHSFVAVCKGWACLRFSPSWVENLRRHRTVQVELYGDKAKREVMKRNPQDGYPVPFSVELCLKQPVARVT